MRIFLILTLNILLLPWVNSQSNIDSLERVLPGSKGKERTQLLIALADANCKSDPAQALEYSQQAHKLAQAQNEQELMAESLSLIGLSHYYSYDLITAAEYLKQSLKLYSASGNKTEEGKKAQNIGLIYLQTHEYDSSEFYLFWAAEVYQSLENQQNIAYCHTNLGLLSYMKSEYASALDHYNQASEIYKQIDDPENHASLQNRIAMTYWSLGILDKALAYALESVKEREKTGTLQQMATGYNNIGAIYKDLDDDEKALEYYRKAVVAHEEAHDSLGMPSALTNIGSVYNGRNQLDSALFYYEQSLKLSEAISDELQSAKTKHNMGLCYHSQGQLETAIIYLREHLNYCQKIGDVNGIATASLNLGKVYFEKEDLVTAKEYLTESLRLADSIDLLPILKSDYSLLSKLKESQGNYQEALSFYKLSKQLNDSIYNIDKAKVISEMETKYETEQKEQEILVLHKDNELQKRNVEYLILLSAGLILLGLISLILFYQIRKNALAKKKLAETEAARLEEKVAHQKRELASGTLTLSRNLEFINSLIEDIRKLTEYVDKDEAFASIRRIVKKLEQQNSDKYWEEFEVRFQEIHRNFYQSLHKQFDGLTPNDLKLCALLKMGMNTKEICSVTFQNVRAVEAARLRLRKKLKLGNGENLAAFLQKF